MMEGGKEPPSSLNLAPTTIHIYIGRGVDHYGLKEWITGPSGSSFSESRGGAEFVNQEFRKNQEEFSSVIHIRFILSPSLRSLHVNFFPCIACLNPVA